MLFDTTYPRMSGALFEYLTAASCRLIVYGSSRARIFLFNGSGGYFHAATSQPLTLSLAVSGAGGLHNAYAEAASKPYVIYAAWCSSTAVDDGDLCLFAVPSGETVDATLVAALTGGTGTYDCWSHPLGAVINDGASNLYPFYHTAAGCFYFQTNNGIQILTGGKATVADTAIDASTVIPYIPRAQMNLFARAAHAAAPALSCTVRISSNTGGTIFTRFVLTNVGNGAGQDQSKENNFCAPLSDPPASFLRYNWSNVPSAGLDLYLSNFILGA